MKKLYVVGGWKNTFDNNGILNPLMEMLLLR
jgi:hypothetical protein